MCEFGTGNKCTEDKKHIRALLGGHGMCRGVARMFSWWDLGNHGGAQGGLGCIDKIKFNFSRWNSGAWR